jgi:hypothetical protein
METDEEVAEKELHFLLGVAGTRLLDAKQGRLCHFFNKPTNDSIKIIMCKAVILFDE